MRLATEICRRFEVAEARESGRVSQKGLLEIALALLGYIVLISSITGRTSTADDGSITRSRG